MDSPDTRLTIREERCYATPTRNPDDDMKYDIIRDRYIVAVLLSFAARLASIVLTILQPMARCLGAVIGLVGLWLKSVITAPVVTFTFPVVCTVLPPVKKSIAFCDRTRLFETCRTAGGMYPHGDVIIRLLDYPSSITH